MDPTFAFAPSELLFSHINIYEKRGLSPIVIRVSSRLFYLCFS